jgi:hypothetical protein
MPLWSFIFNLYELKWVMPPGVVDLFACWIGQYCSSQSITVWKMIPSCLMWCIRREKKIIVFRIVRDRWWSLRPSSKPFITGQQPLIVFILLAFKIFLIFFLFLFRCLSLILPEYLGCALSLFIKILIAYKKKMTLHDYSHSKMTTCSLP